MAPMILLSTLVSHLFGASVGREGTAVQMGGALADQLTSLFRLKLEDRKMLLMAGISGGFASVFGTPLAGAVFALEVLVVGQLQHRAFLACAMAAFLAEQVGAWWGVQHSHYSMGVIPVFGLKTLLVVLVAAALFGVVARLFASGNHQLNHAMKKHIAYPPLRPAIGGVLIAVTATALGAERYLGLGLNTISAAFETTLAPYDFAGKMAFTIASLGSGFKGGEVTPLFYIGATLGNALAPLLQQPVAFMAGLGFVAVFAGAANTPLACTLMAIELFGVQVGGYAAAACAVSTLFSGKTGIYTAQQ
jgi:H+/Cl- antiporter ClcA